MNKIIIDGYYKEKECLEKSQELFLKTGKIMNL